jgi:hypothetical protein
VLSSARRNVFRRGLLFAVGTEVYQHLLPVQRMADPYDVTADLLGLALHL